MSGTSPNYEYWRELSTLCCWELAVLIEGVDPRALDDVVVAEYEPLDYSSTLRIVTSAVEARELARVDNHDHAIHEHTKIYRRAACEWARLRGYADLADNLMNARDKTDSNFEQSQSLTQDSGQKSIFPVEKSDAQDNAGESFSESLNNADLEQAILERKYRGCKRHIVTNWQDIRLEYGDNADGHQVLRYLKRVLDTTEIPALKTVQNHLSALRKEKVIP